MITDKSWKRIQYEPVFKRITLDQYPTETRNTCYDNETHVYTLTTFVYIKKSNIWNIEVQGLK